jgi:hypothetical protein
MRRLLSSFPFALLLFATATSFAIAPARAQSDSQNHTAYHGEGYVTSVDPDRDRVGFIDGQGVRYVLDTYSAQIEVPALSTNHASTGDLVKDMRVRVEGYMLSPTIIEADSVHVLPYVPPGHSENTPEEPAPAPEPAPVLPQESNAHIDLEGTVVSYHPMEQTKLDYDLYTVRVNDHDRNIRVGGPDVVRDTKGESLDGPLSPGDRVQVSGTLLPSGDVHADVVTRLASGQFYPGQKHFEGGNVLHGWVSTEANFFSRDIKVRVRDTDVNIDVPGGIPVRQNGHPASVHDLDKHEAVTVYGQWESTDKFRANRIEAVEDDD